MFKLIWLSVINLWCVVLSSNIKLKVVFLMYLVIWLVFERCDQFFYWFHLWYRYFPNSLPKNLFRCDLSAKTFCCIMTYTSGKRILYLSECFEWVQESFRTRKVQRCMDVSIWWKNSSNLHIASWSCNATPVRTVCCMCGRSFIQMTSLFWSSYTGFQDNQSDV